MHNIERNIYYRNLVTSCYGSFCKNKVKNSSVKVCWWTFIIVLLTERKVVLVKVLNGKDKLFRDEFVLKMNKNKEFTRSSRNEVGTL